MIPREEWPLILNQAQIQECLGVPRTIADSILKNVALDKEKKRYRVTTKRELIKFLEGGQSA